MSDCREINSSAEAGMPKRGLNELPGPAPRQVTRQGDGSRAPRTPVPEPANEPVPAPIPAGAALASAARAAQSAAESDEVLVIDPEDITLSRRDSARLRVSGQFKKFEFYIESTTRAR